MGWVIIGPKMLFKDFGLPLGHFPFNSAAARNFLLASVREIEECGPLIVSIDAEGRNLFEENKVVFNLKKDEAISEINTQVSFIK